MNLHNQIAGFQHIVLIDDDSIQNMLNTKAIQVYFRPASVNITSFEDPEKALVYLQSNDCQHLTPTLIFLDLNMPVLSGWDILNELTKLSLLIKENFILYILTSSIDNNDKIRASQYSLVNGFLSKPLSTHLR